MGLLRVSFLWIFTFLLVLGSSLSASAAEAPAITADSAILVEATTGRVVYEKNADEERPPASMTKMMTCILALEQLRPRTLVTISPVAANTEDVALDWKPGEQLEAQELLKALMMISENGAAVALAQHISGNLPRFSTLMTEKAAELGCKNTQLMNPNGLPNSGHYSTARDMAKIAMYCMKNKEFRNLVGQVKSDIRWTSPKGKSEVLENTNELLETYPGATGIKTGWTSAAGGCLAASAKRNGVELIVIIMHADDTRTRFEDASKLLDYGFSQVKLEKGINKDRVDKKVWVKGGKSASVSVGPAEDVNYPLMNGEDASRYSVEYDVPFVMEAGIKKGQKVGDMVIKYENKPVARVPVVAHESVTKGFSVSSTLIGFVTSLMNVG